MVARVVIPDHLVRGRRTVSQQRTEAWQKFLALYPCKDDLLNWMKNQSFYRDRALRRYIQASVGEGEYAKTAQDLLKVIQQIPSLRVRAFNALLLQKYWRSYIWTVVTEIPELRERIWKLVTRPKRVPLHSLLQFVVFPEFHERAADRILHHPETTPKELITLINSGSKLAGAALEKLLGHPELFKKATYPTSMGEYEYLFSLLLLCTTAERCEQILSALHERDPQIRFHIHSRLRYGGELHWKHIQHILLYFVDHDPTLDDLMPCVERNLLHTEHPAVWSRVLALLEAQELSEQQMCALLEKTNAPVYVERLMALSQLSNRSLRMVAARSQHLGEQAIERLMNQDPSRPDLLEAAWFYAEARRNQNYLVRDELRTRLWELFLGMGPTDQELKDMGERLSGSGQYFQTKARQLIRARKERFHR